MVTATVGGASAFAIGLYCCVSREKGEPNSKGDLKETKNVRKPNREDFL